MKKIMVASKGAIKDSLCCFIPTSLYVWNFFMRHTHTPSVLL